MELVKESESYLLGVHRTKRRSVYSGDLELVQTCALVVKPKETERHSVIIGCSDGTIALWKPSEFNKTELVRSNLKEHLGIIFQLLFIPEVANPRTPCLLLSCCADRTIRVWDPWDRSLKKPCVQSLTGHGGSVLSIAYAKEHLLSCSTDKTIRVWRSDPARDMLLYPWFATVQILDMATSFLRSPPISVNLVQRTESVSCFIGDEQGYLYTCHPPDKNSSDGFQLAKPPQRIHNLSISKMMAVPRENFVVTLSFDNSAQVHDATSGNRLFAAENPKGCRYTATEWDLKNQELILCDEQGYIQFWNIHVDKCLRSMRITDNNDCLNSISLESDSQLLIGTPAGVEVWHLEREGRVKEFKGHEGAIIALLYVAVQDQHLYSASLDNTIRCWDPYDMSCLGVFQEKKTEISCMTYLPGSIVIMTGHDDGNVKLWNIDSGSSMTLEHHTNTVSCMAVAKSDNRDFLLTGSFDCTVAIWDLSKRRALSPVPEYHFKASDSEVLVVCFDARHDTILTGGNDTVVRLWDLQTLECTGALKGHTDAITCLAIDGNFIISGSDDHNIKIWDSQLKFLVKTLKGHTMAVRDLLVVPKVGLVVSCSYDGQILVWDYVNEQIKQKFGHKKEFRCLLFHGQDGSVLAGTDHSGIMIFQIKDDLLVQKKLDFGATCTNLTQISNELFKANGVEVPGPARPPPKPGVGALNGTRWGGRSRRVSQTSRRSSASQAAGVDDKIH